MSWKRTKGGKVGQRYTPTKQRVAQQRIRIVAREALPEGWERSGFFRVEVWAYVKRFDLGDCDNYAKLVLDAIQGIVFDDDRQVVDLRAVKQEAAEEGETIVVVRRGITRVTRVG